MYVYIYIYIGTIKQNKAKKPKVSLYMKQTILNSLMSSLIILNVKSAESDHF